MLVTLGDEDNKWTGARIGPEMIKEMALAYQDRKTAKINFDYAHFSVAEIIDLFVDNKIIEEPKFLRNDCGLKIYIGNHHEVDNCPIINGKRDRNYLNYNTPILCNTIIKAKTTYEDMLDVVHTISVPGDYKNHRRTEGDGGDGLDQSVLCPPDCSIEGECGPPLQSGDTEHCVYDITKQPKPTP